MKTATNFVKLTESPFSRRGSYFAFFNDPGGSEQFGKVRLWLANTRAGGFNFGSVVNRQIQLELLQDKQKLPMVISTTPSQVILDSDYGCVRFCIGGRRFVRCVGGDGLSLALSPSNPGGFIASPVSYNLMDGTWLVGFGQSQVRFIPMKGTLVNEGGRFLLKPDQAGALDLVIEEYTVDVIPGKVDSFPAYEECVAAVEADFAAFAEAVMPSLPAPYEDKRLEALWTTWSMTCDPDGEGLYKHTVVKMMRGTFEHISGWQQAMQAMFLSHDIKLAWGILLSCFDYQDANGRIADIYDNEGIPKNTMKPPFQGVALLWLLKNRDLSGIPLEEKQRLYDGLARWTDYFLLCRDLDRDGIWENRTAGETGWEDGPYFYVGFPLASPDMNAYLEMNMEALALLGKELGRPDAETWGRRADQLAKKIVDTFWDGERWFAFNAETKAAAHTESLPLYCTLILGDRLPKDVVEKSLAYIFRPGCFDTAYGLATESLLSPWYRGGWCQGSVVTPIHLILCMAFASLGRMDLARVTAAKYCDLLKNTGFYHIHNALTGTPELAQTLGVEKTLFWSAWSSSCYLFLADQYLR